MELSGKLSKNHAMSGSILRSTGGSGGAVSSVNGQTGDVVLDAQDVGALPDTTTIPTKTSDLQNDSGFVNASGAAAAAPVQSVNGDTGAVTITVPAAASSGTPAMDGTASRGSSTQYARADHVHPSDTSKITAPSSPATGAFLVYNGSAWVAQTLATWQASSY